MKNGWADMATGLCPNPHNTILVVEDNPQAAKLLSLYLVQAGYEVLVACNGQQALRFAAECHPLAITLDILLPDQDGWQVLSELKASPVTRDIPVVIVSVLDRQTLGFHLGASDYLVKPVDRTELLHALKRCVPRDGLKSACHKVMVVHTNPEALHLLAVILAQENYEVIQALGSEEAASLAKCAQPDLIVTNLLAGGMDFLSLLQGLRATPETARIPVLALHPWILGAQDELMREDGIEFVLIQENELIEERLLPAITLIFKREEQGEWES
ncbi:MAG: response regulator [Gammaproteobacteria bacterium]|nr:response regulator [Gammaproteobacteria bacterium]MBU1731500.1 response regulator [Gammaproteobacteria bacterium]MBU1893005.1 response regulator [Gammaproteobacteria bacterium]